LVLDASALVSMILEELGFESLLEKAEAAELVIIGAPTLFETAMVLSQRLSVDARPGLIGYLNRMNAKIVPFSDEHFEVATNAFLRYGKGRHPAKLNFGDCMAYAVAMLADLPLLYTGTDFSKTDIQST
jgi:ribonuclease VapC